MDHRRQAGAIPRPGIAPESGYATAEFAMVLPALLLIGIGLIWIAGLCLTQLQIQNTAYLVAREVGSGQKIEQAIKPLQIRNLTFAEASDGKYVTIKVNTRRKLFFLPTKLQVTLEAVAVSRIEDYVQVAGR